MSLIIKYLGHSCFHFDTGSFKLIVDPFITGNGLATNINVNDIEAQFILITHGHGDHMADAEVIAKNNDALIISNYEIVTWYASKDINGHAMNTGGIWQFDFGKIKMVEAVHSSMLPDGSYGGSCNGSLIDFHSGASIYLSGDTALTLNMQLIPKFWNKLDLAIMPIGGNFTMHVEDAIIASDFINCNSIIGCHYNSFPPITIDKDKAKAAFKERGKELILLEIEEEYKIING